MLKNEERLLEVIEKDGVVSIVTEGKDGAHLVATWSKFLVINDDNTILIPAGGYNKTQKNVETNNKVQLLVGSNKIEGNNGTGTGFRITAIGYFKTDGPEFELIKNRFSWARAVFEMEVDKIECLM